MNRSSPIPTSPPSASMAQGKIIDLSLDIFDRAPTYTGLPECSVEIKPHPVSGDHLNTGKLTLNLHGTTHLDAPFHLFDKGGNGRAARTRPVHRSSPRHKPRAQKNREAILVTELEPYVGIIVSGSRILLRTDWGRAFGKETYFTDHPFLSLEAAAWFASKEISLLGLDFPTPNPKDVIEVHRILLGAGIVIVEALAHLHQLPEKEFFFMAAPIRIVGGDGAPVRALAIV